MLLSEQLASAQVSEGYTKAKMHNERLEQAVKAASDALKAVGGGSGPMGMTPDSVKKTPEWQKAKRELDRAFAAYQEDSKVFTKKFGKDIVADRDARRSAKLAAKDLLGKKIEL